MEEKDVILEKYEELVKETRNLISKKCGKENVDQNCMNCNPSCEYYRLGNALFNLAVVKDIWGKK